MKWCLAAEGTGELADAAQRYAMSIDMVRGRINVTGAQARGTGDARSLTLAAYECEEGT